MGWVRQVKGYMVRELADRFRGRSAFVLVDFRGLDAPAANELRKTLRRHGARMHVLKNSVARRAFSEIGLAALAERLNGMNAVVVGDDPVSIAREVHAFIARTGKLSVRGAAVDGQILDAEETAALARLPPPDRIRQSFVAAMAGPVSGFVRTLAEVPASLVRALEAIRKNLEG